MQRCTRRACSALGRALEKEQRKKIVQACAESCSSFERTSAFNAAVSSASKSSVEAGTTFKLCHGFAYSILGLRGSLNLRTIRNNKGFSAHGTRSTPSRHSASSSRLSRNVLLRTCLFSRICHSTSSCILCSSRTVRLRRNSMIRASRIGETNEGRGLRKSQHAAPHRIVEV